MSSTSAIQQIAASASTNGTLVFLTNGRPNKQLAWYDRSGKQLGRIAGVGRNFSMSLAPDNKRAVFQRTNAQNAAETQLMDLERGQETRLFAPPLAAPVVWSPDAARVLFSGNVTGARGL